MSYRNEFRKEESDVYFTTRRVVRWFFYIIIIVGLGGWALGWFGEAGRVAKEEFGPKASLKKYEWFINQSNMIQKMDQDIEIVQARIDTMVVENTRSYGEDKSAWPLDVRMQFNKEHTLLNDQLVATKTQRNKLAADYNAQSEKFNWDPYRSEPKRPNEKIIKLE